MESLIPESLFTLTIMWDGLTEEAASPCKPCLGYTVINLLAARLLWFAVFSEYKYEIKSCSQQLTSQSYLWQTQQKWSMCPQGHSLESRGLLWECKRRWDRMPGFLGPLWGRLGSGVQEPAGCRWGQVSPSLWQMPESTHVIAILFWIRILNFQSQRVWEKVNFRALPSSGSIEISLCGVILGLTVGKT